MKRIIEIPSTRILAIIWTLSLFVILILSISINTNPTVEAKYVFSKKWGTQGSGNGQFNHPIGIAVDSSGRVYVVDTGNNRIQQFRLVNPCPNGTTQIVTGVCFVRAWGSLGSGNGQFNNPTDVALDSSGRVYVADKGNNRIQMFKGTGDFIRAWNTESPGTSEFEALIGVAVDSSANQIYAAESRVQGQGVIHKFQLANPCPVGTTEVVSGICFIVKWTYGQIPDPAPGMPDPLHSVLGVGVNSVTHDVFVSLYKDVQVPGSSVYDQYWIVRRAGNGNELTKWGGLASHDNGKFYNPAGIGVSPSGLVYVTDIGTSTIQTFQLIKPVGSCPVGTSQIISGLCFVTKWGSNGSANGQFAGPADVSIGGPLAHVFVADMANNRIQEFYWKTDVGGPGGDGTSPNIAVK
ncbi:MAG TPA: hypothetical protein VLD84_04425 [Nitrososphaeraceae archaeon]|nr:hypothetical protein [Nitrososphaeraceae archaeon]